MKRQNKYHFFFGGFRNSLYLCNVVWLRLYDFAECLKKRYFTNYNIKVMKKLLLMKTMLLLCALIVGSSSVWATDVVIFSAAGGGDVPSDWTLIGTDKGSYWLLDAGGTDNITTSAYDLSTYDKATITAQVATFGSGTNSHAKIEISYDGGTSFTEETTQGNPTSSTFVDISYELQNLSNNVVIRVSNSIASGKGLRFKNFVLTGTSSKTAAGLAYSTAKYATTFGAAFATPELTNPNGLDVTYASSEEGVATVDADGNVTIVGAGTTTITASSEETDDFYEGSASYTLTVNEVVAPYENIAALIAANVKSGTVVSVQLTNAQVQYVNATTKDIFIADETAGIDLYQTTLTYTQGQILNGVLTGKWSPYYNLPELKEVNATGVTVTDGTIEPKVIAANEVKDNVCRLVKIENQTATETDGKYYIDDDVQLFNKYGLSTYYTTNPADYVGIAVVFKEIYELNVISFTEVAEEDVIKVGPAGYATYVTKNAVEFNGVKAYAVTAINEKSVSLQELTSAPAGTPVVVEAAEGEYTCTIIESAEAPEKNLLTYSEEEFESDGTIYALANKPEANGVGFYPVKSGITIPAGKAYLEVGAEVKGFLALGDVADAINNILVETANGNIFNIAGQKVQNITKGGLYIVNGKKVFVK